MPEFCACGTEIPIQMRPNDIKSLHPGNYCFTSRNAQPQSLPLLPRLKECKENESGATPLSRRWENTSTGCYLFVPAALKELRPFAVVV